MNEYTPTTGQIENAWCSRYDGEHSWARGEELRGYEAEFDRWLEQVKAEAWEEGHSSSDTSWDHIYSGHSVPEGELCPECFTGNPYRKEDA